MKMKRINKNKTGILLLAAFIAGAINVSAQDSAKKEFVVTVSYNMSDNKMVYLLVNTNTKVGKKVEPVKNSGVNLYLDSVSENNLIAKVKTNEEGVAKAFLPTGLKSAWESSALHKFVAVAEASKEFGETEAEATVTKSKITIDTTSDGDARSIIVKVSAMKGTEWVPVKDVEMKVGISRMGGILSAGDEATYTTDSSGSVTVELKKISLPGDEKGNIVLAAKVENNDQYGNLLVEKTVPWGVAFKPDNSFFNQRTLWSTRNRTPPWLLFMAYSIVLGVWGTIIYLVSKFLKIKKMGKEFDKNLSH
jgi:hypothetical protein